MNGIHTCVVRCPRLVKSCRGVAPVLGLVQRKKTLNHGITNRARKENTRDQCTKYNILNEEPCKQNRV
jgi:hypothetical protein